jgi:hypothetical protein
MLYLIQCRVTRTHQNLSSPRQEVITKLVTANSPNEADRKYEEVVRAKYAHEQPTSVKFELLMFADEIK